MKKLILSLCIFIISICTHNTTSAKSFHTKQPYHVSKTHKKSTRPNVRIVKASWYGKRWNNRKTASGEKFNYLSLTAAHKKLPFGTKLLVTYPKTGKSVIVKINDRGPYIKGRSLDLSKGAAIKLGITKVGVSYIKYTVIQKPNKKYKT